MFDSERNITLEYINKLQREIRKGATDSDESLFNKLLLETYADATNNGPVVVNNKQEIIVINKRFSELKNVDLITTPLKNSKGEYYGRLWCFREETGDKSFNGKNKVRSKNLSKVTDTMR